jgi:hypothetical protein
MPMESHTGGYFFLVAIFEWTVLEVSCSDPIKGCADQVFQNRYEDDPILGHRLYREIRRVEQLKKEPGKRSRGKGGSIILPVVSYQWETVASNFDEFDDVAVS